MASLTGQLVAETYKALLKTIDNDILTASEKQITDGLGGGSNVFIDSQGFLRANKYKVTNGLATQFLKADGSLDANTYLTGITSSQIITALGYTPVPTTRTLTINGTTYDLSANRSWTVAGTAAIWGNITGTLSNQTDLQTALNAKFNNPTGTISQYIRGDGTLATFPTLPGGLPTGGTAGQILAKIDATDYNTQWIDNYATQTKNEVKLGATLAKGTAVYVSGSTGGSGTNMIVMAASNASEALSSKTFGLLETGGATNDFVKCVTFGLIAGLDTSTAQAGDPVWLGVNGALLFGLANKPVAPANMVYIGVVTRVQSNNGEIFVNVQNGFEIEELHDVLITSKANNQGLFYESSTGLWKNKSIATVLGYTPQAQLNGTGFVKASGTTISYDNSTYLTTADAALTYLALTGGTLTGSITATSFVKAGGTSVQYLKADGSVAEITGDIVSGAGSAGYVPKWTSAIVLGSSILYDNGTSMAIGSTNVNYHAYGRSLTGSGFGSTSFGFEAVTGSTTNGALIGGLSLVIAGNDSTRRIGSAIQSYISGATSTHQGADLRFFVKPDNAVLLEVVRMTSAGITFNKDLTAANITATTFVKSGGLSTQFLMADGSVSTLSSPVTGSGSAGYIPKWTAAANIGSSIIYEDISIGIAYTTPNRGGYGRTLSGAAFGSASFGFEAVSNTTTNGGLIGGLSFIVNQNDSSRIVGSAIQSNLVGTTATNYGADLRFFAKADGVFTIAEVARMTSAGLRVYGTIVKDGGTASQYLMADGSVTSFSGVTGSGTTNFLPKWTSGSGLGNSVIYEINSKVFIGTTTESGYKLDVNAGAASGISVTNSAQVLSLAVYNTTFNTIIRFTSVANPFWDLQANTDGSFQIDRSDTAVMTFATSGNVLINTQTDSGYRLDVNGTSRLASNLYISGGTNVNTGNGIHIYYESNFAQLQLNGATNGGSLIDFSTSGTDYRGRIIFLNSTNAMQFITDNSTGSPCLTLASSGIATFSNSIISGASITIGTGGNYTTGSIYSDASWGMIFRAKSASPTNAEYRWANSADAELMRISPSGGLQIGTTPDSGFKIDVAGTSRFNGNMTLSGNRSILLANNTVAAGGVVFYNSTTNTVKSGIGSYYNIGEEGALEFLAGGATTRMFLSSQGNLGIGANGFSEISFGAPILKLAGSRATIGLVSSGSLATIAMMANQNTATAIHINHDSSGNTEIYNYAAGAVVVNIKSNGNFLIGTTTDNGTKLNINAGSASGINVANAAAVLSLSLGNSTNNTIVRMTSSSNTFWDLQANTDGTFQIDRGDVAAITFATSRAATFSSSVTATSFFESSDFRLKTLIEHNPIVDGIENLQAKLYEKNGKIELGYFAQDAEKLMPYAVTKNADGFLTLSYREVHTAKIARLEQRVAELEKQLNLN